MRHDRHYVDELFRGRDDASRDTTQSVQRPAPVPSAPAGAPPLTRALTEVADGLDAALACWNVSSERPNWSYAATLNRLTRVEMQRVKRLAEGLRVLTETPSLIRRPVDLSAMVTRAQECTEPERRLVDVTLTSTTRGPALVAPGDERLLDLAFASWLQGMTALVAVSPDPTFHLGVTAESDAVTVELSTASAEIPESLAARFFDHRFHDRPGEYAAAVALAAAKRIIELHAGQVSVERLAPTGCRVALTLPL